MASAKKVIAFFMHLHMVKIREFWKIRKITERRRMPFLLNKCPKLVVPEEVVQDFWENTIGLYEQLEDYKEAVKNWRKEKGYFLSIYYEKRQSWKKVAISRTNFNMIVLKSWIDRERSIWELIWFVKNIFVFWVGNRVWSECSLTFDKWVGYWQFVMKKSLMV